MNSTAHSTKGREELIDQLLYELHRMVFASNDLINRYSSKMGLHGKDGKRYYKFGRRNWQELPSPPRN